MELRYIGFDQAQNTRVYEFDCRAEDKSTMRFGVSIDMALFLRHHVGIQEGPTLCARKLSADFEARHRGEHELTNEDLAAYVAERTAAKARKANQQRASHKGAQTGAGAGARPVMAAVGLRTGDERSAIGAKSPSAALRPGTRGSLDTPSRS